MEAPNHSRTTAQSQLTSWGERKLPTSSIAATYAAAPQTNVTFNPKWMAMIIADTDPSTLAAAFIAHAHSTRLSSNSESARNPVGKGIPIANPNGTINAALMATFNANAAPINDESATGSTNT